MSYPRNAASPPPIAVGEIYQLSDGAIQTSSVSVRVKIGTGSFAAGSGTLTCDTTSGTWCYTPTQAETNADTFVVSIYKASCTTVSITVATSASATAGYVGTDQGKIANATATVNLSSTTIGDVTEKTGFKLASDGLDEITTTVTGVASTFPQMLVQVWRRFFKKADRDATTIQTYADDGTTVLTEQTISDSGGVETQGAASEP